MPSTETQPTPTKTQRMSGVLPSPVTPTLQRTRPAMVRDDNSSAGHWRMSEDSDTTSISDITIPSSHENSTALSTPTSASLHSSQQHPHTQTHNDNNNNPIRSYESREHRRESSLLAHLELSEDETRAWQAIASPQRPQLPHPRPRMNQQPRSVPAYCFPSLRGKILTPSTTPTIEFDDKILELERPDVRRERSDKRYSVYVSDKDFDVPKGGWMNKLRHGQSNSISDMFAFSRKQKGHKPTKSASDLDHW